MHITKFGENSWSLLVIIQKWKVGVPRADNSKFDEICPPAIQIPDLYNIYAHTKFGEYLLMFTQVIIRKWNTDGRLMDVQYEIIIPLHYRLTGYKKLELSMLHLRLVL